MTRKRGAPSARGPRIRRLTQPQIAQVLARNSIGRVAFVLDSQIELHPVHYVYADGHVYGRTSFGSKYVAWMHKPWVAFEVDESDGPFDWRSVIIKGTVVLLQPAGIPAMQDDYKRAVKAIRTVLPSAFSSRDPTPYRSVVFRIEPHEITGRAASTR